MPSSAAPIGCIRLAGHVPAGGRACGIGRCDAHPDSPHSAGAPSYDPALNGRPHERPLIDKGYVSTATVIALGEFVGSIDRRRRDRRSYPTTGSCPQPTESDPGRSPARAGRHAGPR